MNEIESRIYIFFSTLLLILLGSAVAYVITKSISKPIYNFVDQIKKTYSGNIVQTIDTKRISEQELLGNVANELQLTYKNLFNEIEERKAAKEKIEERNQEILQINNHLNNVNADLENKVNERTQVLAESESRFRNAIIYSPFPLMIHAGGEVIQLSKAWTDITGYDITEIPTTDSWTEKAYGDKSKEMQQIIIDNYLKLDKLYHHGEQEIFIKDGSKRIWNFSVSPIGKLADGRKVIITMAVDVTERKLNEQSLLKLSIAVEQNPATIVITDLQGNIEYVNQKFCEITGYTKEEAMGNNPRVLKSGSQPDEFYKTLWKTIIEGKVWRGDFHNKRKNGELFWESATISPIRNNEGKVINFLAIKEDITEKKMLEMQLEKVLQNMESTNWELKIVNDELKEEIEERTRIEEDLKLQKNLLGQMNDSLEDQVKQELAVNREKDQVLIMKSRQAAMGEMIGNIAHQWRQPLNAVNLMVFDLQEAYNYGELTKEYIEKQVAEIKSQILHMSQTIDDFRNFFKPNKEKEDVNLKKTIFKTYSFVEANFKNLSINANFEITEELYIKGYSNEMSQVLLNIYNNAKDALTERKISNPTINTKLYKENKYAVIAISDNAGGISNEIIYKIFDPYYSTKEQGTGIGLYMAKTIIKKNMNGKITAENTGDGVVFKIYLPLI